MDKVKENCKESVRHPNNIYGISKPCKRFAVKDGFCKQHHPDEVKKREEQRAKKLDATPFNMFTRY